MTFLLAPKFERDNEGKLKRLNGGHYRFTLVLMDAETREEIGFFYGWRITPDGKTLLPPQSITQRGGIFTMGSLDSRIIDAILSVFREQKEAVPST